MDDAASGLIPKNRILAVLPADDYQRVRGLSEQVSLVRGDTIYRAGDKIDRCYFPDRGMISLLSLSENGNSVEIGYTGFEGMIGLPLFFGRNEMPYQALAQSPSDCLVMNADAAIDMFERSTFFRDAVLRFSYVVLKQVSQTCVCNQFHTIESRICRWLSVMCERSGQKHLRLTQEFLALMLGVQRTSVGIAAGSMQDRGIIKYSRGLIEVLDIERLRGLACECFHVVNAEYHRFLSEIGAKPDVATR
jgi:CRP-like cAMP-binding protein